MAASRALSSRFSKNLAAASTVLPVASWTAQTAHGHRQAFALEPRALAQRHTCAASCSARSRHEHSRTRFAGNDGADFGTTPSNSKVYTRRLPRLPTCSTVTGVALPYSSTSTASVLSCSMGVEEVKPYLAASASRTARVMDGPGTARPRPRGNRAAVDGQASVWDHEARVDLQLGAQAVALFAGPVGRVERERAAAQAWGSSTRRRRTPMTR